MDGKTFEIAILKEEVLIHVITILHLETHFLKRAIHSFTNFSYKPNRLKICNCHFVYPLMMHLFKKNFNKLYETAYFVCAFPFLLTALVAHWCCLTYVTNS